MIAKRIIHSIRLSLIVTSLMSLTVLSNAHAARSEQEEVFTTTIKGKDGNEHLTSVSVTIDQEAGLTWDGHVRWFKSRVARLDIPSEAEKGEWSPDTSFLDSTTIATADTSHFYTVILLNGTVIRVNQDGPQVNVSHELEERLTKPNPKLNVKNWMDSFGNYLTLITEGKGQNKVGYLLFKNHILKVLSLPANMTNLTELSLHWNDGIKPILVKPGKGKKPVNASKLEFTKSAIGSFYHSDTLTEVDNTSTDSADVKTDMNQMLYEQSQALDASTKALNKATALLNQRSGGAKRAARTPTVTLDDSRLQDMVVKNEEGDEVDLVEALKSFVEDIAPVKMRQEEYDYFGTEIRKSLIGMNMRKGGSVRVVGSPGTGKSYFSDVLVSYIRSHGPGSEALQDRLYLRLNASALQAGTKYTGAVETRMNAIKEAAALIPVVLVVDEMHTLVGAGTHVSNANDIFQLIKTELASGRIKIIGTTTSGEWTNHFSKDPALMERFPIEIAIKEPTAEKMLGIMHSFMKSEYPDNKIAVSDKMLEHIIGTASLFDPIGANPRKSLRLLDFVMSAATHDSLETVDSHWVIEYASSLYNYDISSLTPARIRQRLVDFSATVDKSMFGNDEAKVQVREALGEHFFHQFNGTSRKPFAALLYGQRGVGKTSFANLIAKGLGFEMAKIMMADYGHAYEVQGFLSRLALAIRKNPYQVIMLDELEKADPAVQRAILQVLEDGRFEANISGHGQSIQMTEVDASKIIFIGTTNAAQHLANVPHTSDQFENQAEADGLNSYVLDRFYNRIPIQNPDVKSIDGILAMKWEAQSELFAKSGHKIEVDLHQLTQELKASVAKPAAAPSMGFRNANAGEQADYSVRELERAISAVSKKLSTYFLEHPEEKSATVTFINGKWVAKGVAPLAPALPAVVAHGSAAKLTCSELFH